MTRFAAVALLAAVVVGCGGGGRGTSLSVEVENGFGRQHYRLTCEPAGGDVPSATQLCRLLTDNADVMLFMPENHSTCIGGHGTIHLRVRGQFNGRRVDATDIDACQGNPEAERLWLSELPKPPQPA
jgi:subtilisin inhibitor-like